MFLVSLSLQSTSFCLHTLLPFIFFSCFFPVHCQGGSGAYPSMHQLEGWETSWTGCQSITFHILQSTLNYRRKLAWKMGGHANQTQRGPKTEPNYELVIFKSKMLGGKEARRRTTDSAREFSASIQSSTVHTDANCTQRTFWYELQLRHKLKSRTQAWPDVAKNKSQLSLPPLI